MTPEQKPPPPPPESPLEVFRRMEGNRRLGKKMDVPRFLSDVQTLDQLKATEVPELLEHLRNLGKTRIIWETLFNRLREGGQQNDWSSVIQDIHLAELLGMQELPEMADFLSQLKNKYEGPEPSPVKEPEQPEIPVYDKPWQEIFGRGASEISGNWSSSSHVFRPEKNPKVVVKVFDKHPQYFQLELWALQELQGLTGVVQLIGYSESQKPPYLVKKYIEGGDFYSRYLSSAPFFPANPQEAKQDKEFREDPNRDLEARKLYQQEFENAKIVAQWLISAMETLGEIHKRGIIVGDFKFADYPWDAENKRAILIDLTNAQPLDRRSPHYDKNSQVTPTKDIQSLLQVFFSQTNVGSESGFWIRDKMSTEWKNPKGGLLMYFTQEAIDLLRTGSQKTEASESLSQIINMAETLLEGDLFNPKPSAQEFAQALKDYFKEVGIDISQTSALPETVSKLEDRRALEQAALQQAEALAKQTAVPLTEDTLAKYEQWKQSREGKQE